MENFYIRERGSEGFFKGAWKRGSEVSLLHLRIPILFPSFLRSPVLF